MSGKKKMEENKAVVQSIDPSVFNVTIAVSLALIGGVIKYLQEVKKSGSWKSTLRDVVIDLLVSGFVGLLMALLLTGIGANQWLVWFASGYCGHIGGRSFGLARNYLKNQGLIK